MGNDKEVERICTLAAVGARLPPERTTPVRALERHFHAGARSGVVRSGAKKDWRPACAGRQKPNPKSRSAICQRHSAFQQTIGEPFRLHHDGEDGGHTRNPGLSGLRMFACRYSKQAKYQKRETPNSKSQTPNRPPNCLGSLGVGIFLGFEI